MIITAQRGPPRIKTELLHLKTASANADTPSHLISMILYQ